MCTYNFLYMCFGMFVCVCAYGARCIDLALVARVRARTATLSLRGPADVAPGFLFGGGGAQGQAAAAPSPCWGKGNDRRPSQGQLCFHM